MAINFAAANMAGLNNPGTEIITLVKDGSGNFINPPSYDKMRAYLCSGEVPMLFVTDEAGETGSFYQFVDYSETENKIRFSNDVNAIEFSAGAVAPVVSDVVPKPMTYDYMPEGYPKKTLGTATLMEEQELAFALEEGKYTAYLTEALKLAVGQTYTVNWDGTEYESVCSAFNSFPVLGNLSIFGLGDDTGEPFLYSSSGRAFFTTLDTSSSHTISVKTTEEVAAPMVEEFLPAIPADKLPAIPADKLPAIPADKLEFPIIKISGDIQNTIAGPTQPTYDVTNLDNSGIIAAINAGIFAVQDDGNLYFPTSADVSANNDAFIWIVFNSASRIYFAELSCNAGLTVFFRNNCYYIDATQLG